MSTSPLPTNPPAIPSKPPQSFYKTLLNSKIFQYASSPDLHDSYTDDSENEADLKAYTDQLKSYKLKHTYTKWNLPPPPSPPPAQFNTDTNNFLNRNALPVLSDAIYAAWPRDNTELYNIQRDKYIESLDTHHDTLAFIDSELDKEEPLVLPQAYTDEELNLLQSNYQSTIDEIAHCTTQFCPEQKLLYDRAIRLALEIDSPEHMYHYRKCRFDRILTLKNPDDCQRPMYSLIEELMPRVLKSIEKTVMLQTGEVLENYIGFHYNAPFWFNGAGDVWRRTQHNTSLLSASSSNTTPCKHLEEDMNQCITDPSKTDDDCYYAYTQQKICASGLHCRYLRAPLVNCLNANQFTNYPGVTECIEHLPNFTTCQVQNVPKPEKMVVNIHDVVDPMDMPNFKKNMEHLASDLRKERYNEILSQFEARAKELIDIKSYPDDEFSDTEIIFLFKHKHLPYEECKKRLKELCISKEIQNPYDDILFTDSIALQPVLHDIFAQQRIHDEQIELFRRFHADVAETKEGLTDRIDEHLALLSQIREQVKRRFRPDADLNQYPDVKNVLFFDNYWKMYFAYQPILNTSYPVFPLNHLYHYQDFDYDWVDPKGTISSVPFIRIDRVGENFSPSFFAKSLVKDHPEARLVACHGDLDCDKANKQSGAYLGFPQVDDMSYLNHYRMYFKDRDMYFTCWANDTTCIPSRFPDDNYGTFKDTLWSKNWFYRPDRFEYYCYTDDGDRVVYSISDHKAFLYMKNGLIEPINEQSERYKNISTIFKTQAKVWEKEAVDIMVERQKKETILKAHVDQGGSLLRRDLQNTQFDEKIPYTVHPFASYSQNLDAYRYYLKLKEKERLNGLDVLASDPTIDVRERMKYKYRKFFKFYDPITTLPDDDANKMRDSLILSYHELKLSRHPLGSIIMTEMPPRISDRFNLSEKMQQDSMYNYLQLFQHDSNSAVMFDINPDSPQVKLYMAKHNLTSYDQYMAIIVYAQDFQKEIIDEFHILEFNEMKYYQDFLTTKAAQAANLKLTYTEKLTRLFKLHEKYGKVAPNLGIFGAQFGWSPDGIHHTSEMHQSPILPNPDEYFTFGV